MLTIRCPVCGYTIRNVRDRHPVATCPHTNTIHDAKKPALMVAVALEGAA